MKNLLKKAESFLIQAKEFGLEPSVFNVLNFLSIEYTWDKENKKIVVSDKDKMLLEFLQMMLQKHFPKTQKDEDSPM